MMIKAGHKNSTKTCLDPVIVIDVSSMEKHIKKVESAGGKTVMPVMKIGEFGLYARVSDTEGNIIDIWQTLENC